MTTEISDWNEFLEKSKPAFEERYERKFQSDVSLDDFLQLKTLGTGSFGRVKLVQLKRNENYYAIKIIDKQKIIKLKQVEHTLNEKKILQAVDFPFIVSLEFGFLNNDYVFLVMPFVNGGELFSHLRRFGKFEENYVRFYASQVILSLEYLHYMKVIYRDLKPENILIAKNGYLKLTDLGFCKKIHGRTWTLCGTPEYLAPEIILSKGYGFTVDWWSTGVLIYEMAAGHPPFYSTDPIKIYEKIVAGKYKNSPHFSSELKDLLKNMLQVDITRRYGNLKNGIDDIKRHKFFRSVNWMGILNQKLPVPYEPKLKDEGDTSHFEVYAEEPLRNSPNELYPKEFSDF